MLCKFVAKQLNIHVVGVHFYIHYVHTEFKKLLFLYVSEEAREFYIWNINF
jgi:hypothetical protein